MRCGTRRNYHLLGVRRLYSLLWSLLNITSQVAMKKRGHDWEGGKVDEYVCDHSAIARRLNDTFSVLAVVVLVTED